MRVNSFVYALVVWLLVVVLSVAFACAGEVVDDIEHASAEPPRPYRCFLPFSAVPKFSLVDLKSRPKCVFGYFDVVAANAAVHCRAEADSATQTFYVTVRMEARVLDAAARAAAGLKRGSAASARQHDGARGELTDAIRYSLELRSLSGETAIHYKGFDGSGYSMCCDFWSNPNSTTPTSAGGDFPPAARCDWLEEAGATPSGDAVAVQLIRQCPVSYSEATGAVVSEAENSSVAGSISKPLHRLLVGAWEARLIFYDAVPGAGTDDLPAGTTSSGGGLQLRPLGRLHVPFDVQQVGISPPGDHHDESREAVQPSPIATGPADLAAVDQLRSLEEPPTRGNSKAVVAVATDETDVDATDL